MVVVNQAESTADDTKSVGKKSKTTKGDGNVTIVANSLELQSSLRQVIIGLAQRPFTALDWIVLDSGANASVINHHRDDIYDITPIDHQEAKMANRSKLTLKATCLTGITGFSKWYMAAEGTMPRSLSSVGLTADAGMSTIFDRNFAYILKPGESMVLRQDQIAYIIPRCETTGLYMASWSRFFEPAADYYARMSAEEMPPLKDDSDEDEDD